MIVEINDDFDLEKIMLSGQAFRIKKFDDTYRFISKNEILYISHISGKEYKISTSKKKWVEYWCDYFDLDTNYKGIRAKVPKTDSYAKMACNFSKGIRILRQDLFETFISFIISQNKNIPAIQVCVETFCKAFGRQIKTPYESIYTFPSVASLKNITLKDLEGLGLGYRDKFIYESINTIKYKKNSLESLSGLTTPDLTSRLKEFNGIGDKVANCIALFGYHRLDMVPIDTWISKIINVKYNGINPFPSYGKYAGVIQQYLFYYGRNFDEELKG